MDTLKPEVRPGAREESASPVRIQELSFFCQCYKDRTQRDKPKVDQTKNYKVFLLFLNESLLH